MVLICLRGLFGLNKTVKPILLIFSLYFLTLSPSVRSSVRVYVCVYVSFVDDDGK